MVLRKIYRMLKTYADYPSSASLRRDIEFYKGLSSNPPVRCLISVIDYAEGCESSGLESEVEGG
jgi:hypothetical protein